MRHPPAIPNQPNLVNTSSQGNRVNDTDQVYVINADNTQGNYNASFAEVRSALEAHVLKKGAIPTKNLICKYDGNGLIFEETGGALDDKTNPSITFADSDNPSNISPETITSLENALSINKYNRKNFFTISEKSDHNQNIFSQTEFDEALKNYVRVNGMPLKDLLVEPIYLDGKKSLSFKELTDSSSPFIVKGFNQSDTKTISDDLRSELERIDNSRIDNIKEALKKLYEANPSLTAKQAIIDVYPDGFYVARNLGTEPPQGSTSFHVNITSETQQKIKTIVALKTLYREDPNLDISQAIIDFDQNGKYVARALNAQDESEMQEITLLNSLYGITKFHVKITPERQTKIKAEIEAEKLNDDFNTISSFFATPAPNNESSDQTSTTENENKIKELLTRVLATDEKETESEKTFNEKLKAYFVQMAKADMEKSFKSGKPSKLDDLIKGFGSDETTKGLIYQAINEEDIKIMSSFFATPAPNNESSDQTSNTENENKIKELLTRVLTTDANESESEKEIKKRLKDHFVEIAKAEIEKSFKGGESSKLDKALQILKNSIPDTNTSINFAILNGRITEIKDGVKETIRKEAEIMAKTQTTMDKARIKAEEIIRVVTLTKDELTIYDFFATPAVNPENATKIIELLTRVLTTHEKETESEKEIKKNLKAYFVEMAKAEMEELSEHEHSKLEELLIMPISNANVTTFIKSEIESDDLVNDLTLTKGIYIAKKAAIDNFFSVMTLEENLEEDITKITNAIAVDQKLMKHFQSKLNENSQRITLLKTLLKNFKFPDTIRDCEINIDKLASINISAKKILTSAKNIAAIDAFFKGPYKEGVPEKTKTEIETKILADPELMKYFKDKLDACENKFTTLTNSHPSQRDQESKKLITEKIRKLTTSAQEILTTAQKKIEKITQLVDNVFHSISPSGTQAPETLAEGAEEEKNVHAIEEFLSQLKSAIDKGKSRVGKTHAAKNIKNIKDAFSKSFPSDDSDPSIDFKIEFFNSLVDNLNNPDFVTKYQIKNSPTDQPQSQLSSSFSQAFNGKTIGALNALSDSIKTHEDHKLSTIIFRGKKDLYIQSENGGEIAQSKNLVYSTIFSSLFLASIKRLRSSDSASASADKAPAPEAGSPSWAQPSRASDKHSPPL